MMGGVGTLRDASERAWPAPHEATETSRAPSTAREARLTRPDGRIVAWTESGIRDGRPVLRLPGTPGSRYSLPADQRPWVDRGLRVIVVERPGFGISTRLPGRGFSEHAEDLVAVLDHLGIGRVPVYGGSGAAPHILALAAGHPDRVSACTVGSGAAPLTDEEVGQQLDANVAADALARAGRAAELRLVLEGVRASLLADPSAAYRALMDGVPVHDQAVMADPAWQAANARALTEALAPGVDGWLDEELALLGDWSDVDVADVMCTVTWTHSVADRNCPFSAAERLVRRLPNARFIVQEHSGHLLAGADEGRLLDDLLARAGQVDRADESHPVARALTGE